MAIRPPVLILSATGSNRDRDVAAACDMAGGAPEIVHLNAVIAGEQRLSAYRMLILPGGFSHGDDLGAGKLWAVALSHRLGDQLKEFVAANKPILGICNGFQALVKSGLLPGDSAPVGRVEPLCETRHHTPGTVGSREGLDPTYGVATLATLTRNEHAHFECRWVHLAPNALSPCVFTKGLTEPIFCPVAHGEGRFIARDAATFFAIEGRGGVALRYVDAEGRLTGYPANPNGSAGNIAGITNPSGTILGLMPHPENHIRDVQHPEYHRGARGNSGLALFKNGIAYAAGL